MAYFNFNYVTDPPNDEQVDYQKYINHNFQEINDKTKGFNQSPSNITNPPVGTEAFYPGLPVENQNRIAVWDGNAWVTPVSHTSTWSSWQNLALSTGISYRSGYTLQASVDTLSRKVLLRGGVVYGPTAANWPTGKLIEITSDLSVNLLPKPGGETYWTCAVSQITTAGGYAGAIAKVSQKTSSLISIQVQWYGDSGGGNFIMFDNMHWWY